MPNKTARPRIPSATYRLQFNAQFRFPDARAILDYLHALGISDVYASPFFQASPGSMHGYDVVDHNRLNPEMGNQEDFDAYVAGLKKFGLGQIADFVPNHMGISEPTNSWWMDVLENGPSSVHAGCFDIDWRPLKEELRNKVLLPILGDQYGRVLEKGELRVAFEGGSFFLYYYSTKLPINPRTYEIILQKALNLLGQPDEAKTIEDDVTIAEFRSIMTALEYLPPRTETNPLRIAERAREKEVVKRRLERLCAEAPAVEKAIAQAVELLQGVVGNPNSFDTLHLLIESQAYRLSYWRVAAEEINYRRFFDINSLAAIRMERPEVFESTHQLLWRLLQTGAVTGLRIDHPDGLYDPRGYFQQLQENYARLCDCALPADGRGIYLLGEKILVGDESLRADWPVHGTTGYDFTNQVTQLLVDPAAGRAFHDIYRHFIDRNVNYPFLVYEKKRLTMRLSMANDVAVLGAMLNRLSERNRLFRDFTLDALTTAVREVIACFPVYRTYLAPGQPVSDQDRAALDAAVEGAKRRNAGMETSVFDFLRDILLFKFPPNTDDAGIAEHEAFVMKFQQCTGPIMAKGLEDTAFYIYNRLVALNEVGGDPSQFGATVERFHQQCRNRLGHWPHSMLASSTHDTKRSEDTRARIAALSEMPSTWKQALARWSKLNHAKKTVINGESAPDKNEEYLLYQILLGTWMGDAGGEEEHQTYVRRIQEYMAKAIKEAKVNSSWIQPNEAWDEAVRKFVAAVLKRARGNAFLRAFEPVAKRIAQLGVINSLSQTILKFTVPGVPDIYQGNELWDFSLVDPDNRRPVDYELRRRMLASLKGAQAGELLENWRDGRIKLFVTRAILQYRRETPDLFQFGSYEPIRVTGKYADCVVAFRRHYAGEVMVVIVPRLTNRMSGLPSGERWADTALVFEPSAPCGTLRNLLTGRQVDFSGESARLAVALEDFPFGVFPR